MLTNTLTTEPVRKLFFRYLIPSICGTMVTSIYVLADTIIIGKGIGIDAMAALISSSRCLIFSLAPDFYLVSAVLS